MNIDLALDLLWKTIQAGAVIFLVAFVAMVIVAMFQEMP